MPGQPQRAAPALQPLDATAERVTPRKQASPCSQAKRRGCVTQKPAAGLPLTSPQCLQ